jgi:hypothetical protein
LYSPPTERAGIGRVQGLGIVDVRPVATQPQPIVLIDAPDVGAEPDIGQAEQIAAMVRHRLGRLAKARLGADAPIVHIARGVGDQVVEAEAIGVVGVINDVLGVAFEVAGASASCAVSVLDIGEEARDHARDRRVASIAERGLDRADEGAAIIVEIAVLKGANRGKAVFDEKSEVDVGQGQQLRAVATPVAGAVEIL